jgi:hypothetical protein
VAAKDNYDGVGDIARARKPDIAVCVRNPGAGLGLRANWLGFVFVVLGEILLFMGAGFL